MGFTPKPHEIKWKPEDIGFFWQWHASNAAAQQRHFSALCGTGLLNFLNSMHIRLSSPVVDLGCAGGHLMARLLERGVSVEGIDVSIESISAIKRMFSDDPCFIGAQVGSLEAIPLADNYANVVFLVEVVEHLSHDNMNTAFREIKRVTSVGGKIIVTAPNNENLDARKVICPKCGCVFHRIQHIQSFDKHSLAKLLETYGLCPIVIEELNLFDWQGRDFFERVVGFAKRTIGKLRNRKYPHLICIAQKG